MLAICRICLDKSNGKEGKEDYKVFILAGTFQEQSLDSDLFLVY